MGLQRVRHNLATNTLHFQKGPVGQPNYDAFETHEVERGGQEQMSYRGKQRPVHTGPQRSP